MIFVTIGTTKYPFPRLLTAIDNVLIKINSTEKLIVQSPHPHLFKYSNTQVFDSIGYELLLKYLKTSRITITHGGISTVLQAISNCQNIPIVAPRSSKLNEHLNDHQIFSAKNLINKKSAKIIFPKQDLKKELETYLQKPIKQQRLSSLLCSPKLIANLDDFCSKL